jgi:hypothetical protein
MSGVRNGKMSKFHRHGSRQGTPCPRGMVVMCRERQLELTALHI